MGCDINVLTQRKVDGEWHDVCVKPFNVRNYGLYGFLANVRNIHAVPPLSSKRNLPNDYKMSFDSCLLDGHSSTWLSLEELLNFNYDDSFEDRRVSVEVRPGFIDGGSGNGQMTTFRKFLGQKFFDDLEILKLLGRPEDVRVLMSFDS